ncbi:signal peptidase II [Dehalococcoidia bacterium]|nr:signal peptidase II [Dehalococcoidia bacterium]
MHGALQLNRTRVRILLATLVFGITIAADQITKHATRVNLAVGESFPETWPARFTHVENSGSAFGLFTDQTSFLIGASIVALGVMLYLFRKFGGSSWLIRVSLALQLGGGSSNLYDRIRYGEVTDFIDLRVWPIFNIADSAVVIGIILLGYTVLFLNKTLQAQE